MSRRWKAVLFDLDGTLVDTLSDISRCLNGAMKAQGLPEHSEAVYERIIGGGIRRELQGFVPMEQLDAVMDSYTELYEQNCAVLSQPYPGAERCLAALAGAGIRLGVITNKRDVNAKRMIPHYFPKIPMEIVWGRSAERAMKPDPASGREACNILGLMPEQVLFVGDVPETDIRFARNVGFGCAGASWGYRSKAVLSREQPDFLADSFDEPCHWILGGNI